MKKFITNKITLTIFGLLLLLVLWTLVAVTVGHGTRIFPTPIDTFPTFFSLLGKSDTYLHIGYSLLRMLIGFLISVVAAFILGIIVGNHSKIKHVFNPTMIALKAVPTAVFVYLFLVLIGAEKSPILVVCLITFPIVYESVVAGYTNISPSILMALKLDGTNKILNNLSIKLPLAFPYIAVGLASSFALSFKIEIMAEVISGSTSYGLGNIIRYYQQQDYSDLTPIFAYALIAIILMLLFSLFSYLLKKKLISR